MIKHFNCEGEEKSMKRVLCCIFVLVTLSACSQAQEETIDTTEEEVISTQDVTIPSTVFSSEKQAHIIEEEEMKLSITTYLDSNEALMNASYPFVDVIDGGEKLKRNELEKFDEIRKLAEENDRNFSSYIVNNTLPEDYQEESKRISQYITVSNEMMYGLDEAISTFTDDLSEGKMPKVDIGSIKDTTNVVNGREQKKIEDFLDREGIDTIAFGRADKGKGE
jgi:hypothetical protein